MTGARLAGGVLLLKASARGQRPSVKWAMVTMCIGGGQARLFEISRCANPFALKQTTDMDLNFTPEEEAFRAEVQALPERQAAARIANKVKAGQRLTKADQDEWHAILNERGWLANHWPEEYGGPAGARWRSSFDAEWPPGQCGPRIVPFGVNMLGPVLIKFGNEAQKYWSAHPEW